MVYKNNNGFWISEDLAKEILKQDAEMALLKNQISLEQEKYKVLFKMNQDLYIEINRLEKYRKQNNILVLTTAIGVSISVAELIGIVSFLYLAHTGKF